MVKSTMKTEGSYIVSWSFSEKDTDVLLVGEKKPGESIEIINAFSGKEARDLLVKLSERKEKENNS